MKLIFKQRLLSLFDSYDIYDDQDQVVFKVEGKLSFGHKLLIYNVHDELVGMIKEELLTFMPRFALYKNNQYVGSIRKVFQLFKPAYVLDYLNWSIEGEIMEWNYDIYDENHQRVAKIDKELLHLTDIYILDVEDFQYALDVLMIALAIDIEKCSRQK